MNTMGEHEHDDRVLADALRAVAEDDEGLGASASVEARLMAEARSIARVRSMRMRVIPLAAAAALLIAIALPVWYAAAHRRAPAPREVVSDGSGEVVREEATEFFPLPYSSVPAPGGYVVRMQVPRTALTSFGVPGFGTAGDASATVTADVLVGGDGLARAVRFIRVVRNTN